MLSNKYTQLTSYRYALEPGDGTRYEFMITHHFFNLADSNIWNLSELIAGVGDKGEFVTLTVIIPLSQGSYEFDKYRLAFFADDPSVHRHYLDYAHSHMPACSKPTLAAVMIAAGVLALNPAHVDRAATQMLRWRELFD